MATKVQRPGGVTVLCVMTIVLGSIGLLTGFSAIAVQLFQGRMQTALGKLQPDDEAAQRQQEMVEEANERAREHAVRNWIFAVLRLCIAAGLFLGGILCLGLKSLGRTILLVVFAAGIPFETLQLWPLLETRELTARTFERAMQAQMRKHPRAKAPPPGLDASMKVMGRAFAAMQLAMVLAMFLSKSAFYAFGLWCLTRQRNTGLFLRPAAIDPLGA